MKTMLHFNSNPNAPSKVWGRGEGSVVSDSKKRKGPFGRGWGPSGHTETLGDFLITNKNRFTYSSKSLP